MFNVKPVNVVLYKCTIDNVLSQLSDCYNHNRADLEHVIKNLNVYFYCFQSA